MDFNGKVVLISGSNSGIGKGIALKFASLNANVVITGRDEKRINETVELCSNITAQRIIGIKADLLVENEVKNLIDTTIQEFHKIDILVNNAGIRQLARFGDQDYMHTYDTIMNTNVRCVQVLTLFVVPYLEMTNGSIINISSTAGLIPVIIPTYTRTPTFESASSNKTLDSVVEYCKQNFPLGRIGEIEDVCAMVAFLASDKASCITGALIPVDGGSTASYYSSI